MPNQLGSLDRVFQALADPSRRGIVERLVRGPAPVSELARPLEMSLPAVLQHLQVLEASGLVSSEKVGRVRTCRIEPAVLRAAESWLADQRTAWERQLDQLDDYQTPGTAGVAPGWHLEPTRRPRRRTGPAGGGPMSTDTGTAATTTDDPTREQRR